MIIAIDGPAASGKGTIARQLAAHFGLPHLDTGLLYRAVARIMLDRGFDLANEEIAASIAENLDPADLVSDRLRDAQTGEGASIVAAHPSVRAALLQLQQQFAAQKGGAVLDGRDVGTVIAPQAEVKIFVTASPEERAKRRFKELIGRGDIADSQAAYDAVLADIRKRDARDMGRSAAPLKIAADAVVLDTSALDIAAAFAAALAIVDKMTGKAGGKSGE